MKKILKNIGLFLLMLAITLGIVAILLNTFSITNRSYEEIVNYENAVSEQMSESMIYGTWQPLFENVLSNNSSYMLLENIFKDKDIEGKIGVETFGEKTRYSINRDGMLLIYEYKDGYLQGIEVKIDYYSWGRWGIIGQEHLSFKEINAITLYRFIEQLEKNNIGVSVKLEDNTLYFTGLENCIEKKRGGQTLEDVLGRKIELQDIENCLKLYSDEVGSKNGKVPLYSDNLLYLDCFYVFSSESKVELNEDNIHFYFTFQNEIGGKAWDIIKEVENDEEWGKYEIWDKLYNYYDKYSKTRLSEEWYNYIVNFMENN